MPFVKRVAVSFWESIVEDFTKLPKIILKSLCYAPGFYGINWLLSHHAPSHDMWVGFFFGAFFFTSAPKKSKSDPDKEQPQRLPSSIILPSANWRKSNDHHA